MKKSILKTATILMIVTIVAKIIGFLREALIGFYFGANAYTDIYYTASGFVTGVLFAMTGSISVAFIPIYTKAKYNGRRTFLYSSMVILSIIAVGIVIILEIFAPLISRYIAPSYSSEELITLSSYIRLFALGILFSLLANLFISTLNAENKFGYAAISGLIYSVISIIFVSTFHKTHGITILVCSVVIAYILQCIVLLVRTKSYIHRPKHILEDKILLKSLFAMSIPVLISNTTVEINNLVDRALATGLEEGAVSALSYSSTLFNLVFQIICNTFITIYFTEISNNVVEKRMDLMEKNVKQGALLIILLVTPVMIITNIYGKDIVQIAFMRGTFDSIAVALTGSVTSIYAFSFVFAGLYMLLNKVFYVLDDYKIPTILCVISVIVNIILSIMLSKLFGLQGIISGTVISNAFLTIMLFVMLSKKYKIHVDKIFAKEILKCLFSGMSIYIVLIILKHRFTINNIIINFVFVSVIACLLYFILLIVLKNKTLIELKRILKRKKKI